VLAVRRELRSQAPGDWKARIEKIEGIEIEGAASPWRLQVQATPAALEEVRRSLGELLHIEPLIAHRPS